MYASKGVQNTITHQIKSRKKITSRACFQRGEGFSTTYARVAWWDATRAHFPPLVSVAALYVRRPRSACPLGRVFGLTSRIQPPDRRNVSKDTLRHLAVMDCNTDEELDDADGGQGH